MVWSRELTLVRVLEVNQLCILISTGKIQELEAWLDKNSQLRPHSCCLGTGRLILSFGRILQVTQLAGNGRADLVCWLDFVMKQTKAVSQHM